MTRDFLGSLLAADRPVIMEVKPRSADGDDLFGARSVAEVVADYEAAGAPCLSVVTGRWFGGTAELLCEVVELTDRPVLQKDFVTSRAKVDAACEMGASSVLFTAALLTPSALARLVDHSLEGGLTPFVEVASAAEAAMVPSGERCVVAVNNKDITTRERAAGDIGRSEALLDAVRRTGTRCPVSASGIDHLEVGARLLDTGFAGLLVGVGLSPPPTSRLLDLPIHGRATRDGVVVSGHRCLLGKSSDLGSLGQVGRSWRGPCGATRKGDLLAALTV